MAYASASGSLRSSSSSSFLLQQPIIIKPYSYTFSTYSPPPLTFACASKEGADDGSRRRQQPPPRRKTSRYGTSRRSILKKTFTQEQVDFTSPLSSSDPVVGIIGGGVSGLMCASALEKNGFRSTVFDTGEHGLGGRLGTRMVDSLQSYLVFDHAAQFFTVSDPRFQVIVDEWMDKGLVREWKGLIGELKGGGIFTPLPSSPTRYIGVKGMRPLADSLLSQRSIVELVRPCWISKIEPFNGMWYLSENGKPRGSFDAIVIAHNGKCANRLLSSSGLPLLAKQMKRLELSAIWALLAAFDEPLPIGKSGAIPIFEGAFIKGVHALSWMANNTMKLNPSQSKMSECWTIFSTASYGKQNKVPQENIPSVTAEKVKMDMLHGVETALGLPKASLKPPFYTKVQLWGAALPTNTPQIPCVFDPQGRAGICGDWLLGSSVEAGVLSGISLADHIANYFRSGGIQPENFAVGLHNAFQTIDGHDIGQFPGQDSEQPIQTQTASALL